MAHNQKMSRVQVQSIMADLNPYKERREKSEVDSANIFFTKNGGEPEMDVDPKTGALG